MKRRLGLQKDAASFLKSVPPKHFRQLVLRIFELMQDAEPHDSKQLQGYEYRRLDAGEYRIVYRYTGKEVLIVLIGKRNDNDVYRRLSRKN